MPDGFLMLGAGETVVGHTHRFTPTAKRASFFEPLMSVSGEELRKRA